MDISNVITEDETTGALKLVRQKEKRNIAAGSQESAVRRGVIRFVVVIMDCSAIMNQRDMRPTRLGVVEQVPLIYFSAASCSHELFCGRFCALVSLILLAVRHRWFQYSSTITLTRTRSPSLHLWSSEMERPKKSRICREMPDSTK